MSSNNFARSIQRNERQFRVYYFELKTRNCRISKFEHVCGTRKKPWSIYYLWTGVSDYKLPNKRIQTKECTVNTWDFLYEAKNLCNVYFPLFWFQYEAINHIKGLKNAYLYKIKYSQSITPINYSLHSNTKSILFF